MSPSSSKENKREREKWWESVKQTEEIANNGTKERKNDVRKNCLVADSRICMTLDETILQDFKRRQERKKRIKRSSMLLRCAFKCVRLFVDSEWLLLQQASQWFILLNGRKRSDSLGKMASASRSVTDPSALSGRSSRSQFSFQWTVHEV